MKATFSQKGLKGGYADFILEASGDVSFTGKESVALGRDNVAGMEYLSRDKGQWTGRKETLNAQGTLQGNTLTFRLEPYYVNSLETRGYEFTLFDENGNETFSDIVFIKGVKKSAISSGGFVLADEEKAEITSDRDSELNKISSVVTEALSRISSLKTDIYAVKTSVSGIEQGNLSNSEDSSNKVSSLLKKISEIAAEKQRLSDLLVSTESFLSSSQLSLDPVKMPKAKEMLSKFREAFSELSGDFSSFKDESENKLNALQAKLTSAVTDNAEKRCENGDLSVSQQKKGSSLPIVLGVIGLFAVAAGVGSYFVFGNSSSENPEAKPEAEITVEPVAEPAQESEKTADAVPEPENTPKSEPVAAEPAPLSTRQRVSQFLASKGTAEEAVDLAKQLDAKSVEEQDSVFKLYYYAAMKDNSEGALKYAECLDPSYPQWGTIQKDAVEAMSYYKLHPNGSGLMENMKKWLEESAGSGNQDAQKWLRQIK
ncbi:hypothetical protein [Succinivibrio dextrinosolvens]|uniref:hypothetical protein n=1 Tax=Succinivibrio dextrinosolvens TaxID=83771 RepID=UPI0019204E5E|nr:hypothetical protein [Succinivibrio dextrinosolvens]